MSRLGRGLLALGLAVVLGACGGGTSPAATPTAVLQALGGVDAALAAHDWTRARAALDELVRRTVQARENGDMSEDRADAVLAAAARLATGVPRATPSPTPVATTPAPRVTEDDGDGDDEDEGGKRKGKRRD